MHPSRQPSFGFLRRGGGGPRRVTSGSEEPGEAPRPPAAALVDVRTRACACVYHLLGEPTNGGRLGPAQSSLDPRKSIKDPAPLAHALTIGTVGAQSSALTFDPFGAQCVAGIERETVGELAKELLVVCTHQQPQSAPTDVVLRQVVPCRLLGSAASLSLSLSLCLALLSLCPCIALLPMGHAASPTSP